MLINFFALGLCVGYSKAAANYNLTYYSKLGSRDVAIKWMLPVAL